MVVCCNTIERSTIYNLKTCLPIHLKKKSFLKNMWCTSHLPYYLRHTGVLEKQSF